MRLVDGDLPRAAAFGEFVAEPTLASARFGDHPHDLRVPRNGLIECGLQSRHLTLTPDELCEPACTGHIEAGAHATHALKLEHTNRLRQAPYFMASEITEREESLACEGRRLRYV